MPKGRPPLTEDVLRQRVRDYCGRYEVNLNPEGLPAYPAGRRETPQHREWIVLYKAFSRLQARARFADPAGRETLVRSQKGRCPVCSQKIEATALLDRDRTGQARGVIHDTCAKLVRLADAAGPEALPRVSAYLWPDGPAQKPEGATQKPEGPTQKAR